MCQRDSVLRYAGHVPHWSFSCDHYIARFWYASGHPYIEIFSRNKLAWLLAQETFADIPRSDQRNTRVSFCWSASPIVYDTPKVVFNWLYFPIHRNPSQRGVFEGMGLFGAEVSVFINSPR